MKKLFKHKKTILIAFLALAVGGLVYTGSTFAFFQDKTNPIENKIETKELDTTMNEKDVPNNNNNMEKKPYVTNTGSADVLVRARVVISPESEFNKYFGLNGLGGEILVDGLSNEVLNDWELGKDGYYYFKNILKPNEKTGYLFTNVVVRNADGNYTLFENASDEVKKKINGMEITVYHEAVPTMVKIGTEVVNAVDSNDSLNVVNAQKIWNYFDNNNN